MRLTLNISATINKLIRPPVWAGVEQALHLACHRVDSALVWAFVQIAAMAGERRIFDIIATAMLTGDNVFDVMRHCAVVLVKQSALATTSGPLPNKRPGSGIHR